MNKPDTKLPKILYIMGTARSGSTILEVLLSNGRGVFGAGELTSLIQDGFVENKQCSCGASCADCDIWRKVREHLKLDKQEFEEWALLQKKMDWHDGFLKQFFFTMPRKDNLRYLELNARLLKAIQETTGCMIILDSSKYAGRALALLRILNADVKVIRLTRSPAGLIQSHRKPNKDEQLPKHPVSTLIYYCVTLVLLKVASIVLKDNLYCIRYEDLLANPTGSIQRIEDWSGMDFALTRDKLQRKDAFSVGHLVTGNRLRKKGEVRFQINAGDMTPEESGVVVMIMNFWRWILRF